MNQDHPASRSPTGTRRQAVRCGACGTDITPSCLAFSLPTAPQPTVVLVSPVNCPECHAVLIHLSTPSLIIRPLS